MRVIGFVALVLVIACGPPESNGPYVDYDVDNDGDGYSEEAGDCADHSPAAYPGAVEECNGIDDNCDGQWDEDLPDCDWSAEENVDSGDSAADTGV